MNILIVDDHPIVQRGLKLLLEAERGWSVTGLASTADAALEMARAQRPEIAIVDVNLPDGNGLDVASTIKEISPETAIIILSMHMNEHYVRAARKKGASAYVSKHVAEQEIVRAIRAVVAGRSYPDDFGAAHPGEAAGRTSGAAPAVLTARESQVLQLLAGGCQNKEVAQQLNISVRTAEKHRASIMRKLHLSNQAELIRFALQNDLVDLPAPALPPQS